jgi:hypothetical protein
MLTAYDYPTARLIDEAGVPTILEGDTLGMVVLGHDSTIPVRLDDIIRHTARRASRVGGVSGRRSGRDGPPGGSWRLLPVQPLREAAALDLFYEAQVHHGVGRYCGGPGVDRR